jgi:pyruvate/2-oxoglutarate dehydrogenase complex dihydrolipoamide dehydrogenase (E3) component
VPQIPGLDGGTTVAARSIFGYGAELKGKIVAIVGGGQVGYETADYIRKWCDRVILVEALEELATDAEPIYREEVLEKLQKDTTVEIRTGSTVAEIGDGSITIEGGGKRESLTVDRVLLSVGASPLRSLAQQLAKELPEIPVHTIGDAHQPRSLLEATREGFWTAMRL